MIKQSQELRQTQKLSPLQLQTIQFIELPVMELNQKVKDMLDENPVVEDVSPDSDEDKDLSIDELKEDDYIPEYKTRVKNWGKDERPEYNPFSVQESFIQSLYRQLGYRSLTAHEEEVASFIIGSLDDDGYLRRDLESIVDDLAFHANVQTDSAEVERMLSVIQDMEPAGVGARDLRECLLLQLKACGRSQDVADAEDILSKEFQEFSNRHFNKVMSRLGLDEKRLKAAMDRIVKLNPSPGGDAGNSYDDQASQVVPDFILHEEDGNFTFEMPRCHIPEIRLNHKYADLLEQSQGSSERSRKEAVSFVKQKLDSAKWFVEALKQRQNTLQKTMQAILDYQHDYFIDGDETRHRPMVLKDIAEITGFDISTISRVVNSKYIETHFGIFPLKHFFSEGLENREGEEISTRELKRVLQDCIDTEDKKKPLTDEQLVVEMEKKGYKVARRTIAKYRGQLGIPLARWRKEI